MLFYGIMIGLGVIFLILFSLLLINGSKLKSLSIKIEEAENNVSDILKEKHDLLTSVDSIMKSKDKDDLFPGLDKINLDDISNIELNKELSKYDKVIIELTDFNKEIVYDDNEQEIFEKLIKTNINRLAIEKYYNDNVTKFNKLLDKFPSNIISKFRDYSKKDLFKNEKEEIFEILKK